MNTTSWNADDTDTKLYHEGDTIYAEYLNRDYPAGALVTNSNDLTKYLQELIKGHAGQGTLLTQESYATLFNTTYAIEISKEAFPEEENPFMNIMYDKGIFMGIAPEGFIGHTGADPGVVSFMFFNRETGRGFTFVTNRTIWYGFDDALNDLWDIIDLLEKATKAE
jgi:CubicO group peptidase (beta-lactamase class C family)